MHPLTHTTLVGNWATLLLATNKNGEIDYKRMGDEIDILIISLRNLFEWDSRRVLYSK